MTVEDATVDEEGADDGVAASAPPEGDAGADRPDVEAVPFVTDEAD